MYNRPFKGGFCFKHYKHPSRAYLLNAHFYRRRTPMGFD